jgi:hypothetical protein
MGTRSRHICTVDFDVRHPVSDNSEVRRLWILRPRTDLTRVASAYYSEKDRAASRSGARYRRLRRSMSVNAGTSPDR